MEIVENFSFISVFPQKVLFVTFIPKCFTRNVCSYFSLNDTRANTFFCCVKNDSNWDENRRGEFDLASVKIGVWTLTFINPLISWTLNFTLRKIGLTSTFCFLQKKKSNSWFWLLTGGKRFWLEKFSQLIVTLRFSEKSKTLRSTGIASSNRFPESVSVANLILVFQTPVAVNSRKKWISNRTSDSSLFIAFFWKDDSFWKPVRWRCSWISFVFPSTPRSIISSRIRWASPFAAHV